MYTYQVRNVNRCQIGTYSACCLIVDYLIYESVEKVESFLITVKHRSIDSRLLINEYCEGVCVSTGRLIVRVLTVRMCLNVMLPK